MTRWRVGLAALPAVVAVLGGGCTADPTSPANPPSVAPPSGASAGPSGASAGGSTELRIVVDPGTGTPTSTTLTCDPPGGTHPDPAAACAALAAHPDALRPVAAGTQCTQVYGGPETATITGTYRGAAVAARLSRSDGCEIARWDQLTGVLPPGGTR